MKGIHLATRHLATCYDNTVRPDLILNTQPRQSLGHRCNAIALFYTEFLGTGQCRRSSRTRSRNKEDRKLIDCERNQILRYFNARQGSRPNAQISHRLTADLALIQYLDICTHQRQDSDNTRACWVHAYVLKGEVRAFGNRGSHQEKGR